MQEEKKHGYERDLQLDITGVESQDNWFPSFFIVN